MAATFTIRFYRLEEDGNKTKLVVCAGLDEQFIKFLSGVASYFKAFNAGLKESEKKELDVCFPNINRDLVIKLMSHYKWLYMPSGGQDPAWDISIYVVALADYLGDNTFHQYKFLGGGITFTVKNEETTIVPAHIDMNGDYVGEKDVQRVTIETMKNINIESNSFNSVENLLNACCEKLACYKEDGFQIRSVITSRKEYVEVVIPGNYSYSLPRERSEDNPNVYHRFVCNITSTSPNIKVEQLRDIDGDYVEIHFKTVERVYGINVPEDFPAGLGEDQIQYCVDAYCLNIAAEWSSPYRKVWTFWKKSPQIARVIWEDNYDEVMIMFKLNKKSRVSIYSKYGKGLEEMLEYCDRIAKSVEPEFDFDDAGLKSIEAEANAVYSIINKKYRGYIKRELPSDEILRIEKETGSDKYEYVRLYYYRLPALEQRWNNRYEMLAAERRKQFKSYAPMKKKREVVIH